MNRRPVAKRTTRLPRAERDRLVALLRALADPTRLEIWRMVAAGDGGVSVSDVTRRFHVGQPTVSHHLKVLRDAGLLRVSRTGVWAHHGADAKAARGAAREIAALLAAKPARRP